MSVIELRKNFTILHVEFELVCLVPKEMADNVIFVSEDERVDEERAANDVGVLMSIDFCSILNIIKRCKNRPPHTRQKRMTRKAQRIPHVSGHS